MLVVDGTFEEQIDEIATYLDSLDQNESKVQEQVEQHIQQDDKEAAIQAIVDSSSVLSNASEKGEFVRPARKELLVYHLADLYPDYEPSHNLFIHILLSSDNFSKHLSPALSDIGKVPSFADGALVTYKILSTLYNNSPSQFRLPIFNALLKLTKEHNLYELFGHRIQSIQSSLREWEASAEDSRAVYVALADLCQDAEDNTKATDFLTRAVETFTAGEESNSLTIRAVNAVLNEKERLTVDDLLILPAVKDLQHTSSGHYELLNLLSSGQLADAKQFNASHESFYSANSVSQPIVEYKFRILTVASLAARQDNRKLRYPDVSRALEVPESEVETWIIETIKSGLVEGKLSQPSSVFLVHRATYRTFEHEQWEEVSAKLASWKESLQGILEVIANVQNDNQQQLTNGFGSEVDEEEARSHVHSDSESVDGKA